MENGLISDEQITASSEYSPNHAANQGRLRFLVSGSKYGSWVASTRDANQWLQIDLNSQTTAVKRIATQGRQDGAYWVKSYNLQYSNDGVTFLFYRQEGEIVTKVHYTTSKMAIALSFAESYSRLYNYWENSRVLIGQEL